MLIARLEEQRALAVGEDVAHPADARGDDRTRERRRFDEHARESVVMRRQHGEVAGEVVRNEIEAIDGGGVRHGRALWQLAFDLADDEEVHVVRASVAGETADQFLHAGDVGLCPAITQREISVVFHRLRA